MTKKTVGQAAVDLTRKDPITRDPIAIEREAHKEYEKNVMMCLENSKNKYRGDFYIVVLTKKEKKLQNVIRNIYFSRGSCPTPHYDQTVYKYARENDQLQFCWVLPSKDTCELFKDNVARIDPLEYELLENVLNLYDGTLHELAQTLNGEQKDSMTLVH